MLYQAPPKFPSHPLSHLLSLHTSGTIPNVNSHNTQLGAFDSNLHNQTNSKNSNQTLNVCNGQIGKSFTIAAILGLKKNAAAVAAAVASGENNNNSNNSSFNGVVNLSLNHHRNFSNMHNTSNTALQNLQQLHQQHATAAFASRERTRGTFYKFE